MKKILVSLLAVMVVLSMSVPVFAAETGKEHRYRNNDSVHTQTDPGKYLNDAQGSAGVSAGIMKFNKYLITNQGSSEPEMKFDFLIEPGVAMSYNIGTSKFEVMKPVVGNRTSATDNISGANISAMPKFKAATNQTPDTKTTTNDKTTVTFNDTSATKNTSIQTGDNIHLDAREQYQKEEIQLDFTDVYFYEPGVYRFKLTEAASTASGYTAPSGIYYDTQEVDTHPQDASAAHKTLKTNPESTPDNAGSKERILDVYVVDKDDGSGDLKVESYVLYEKTNGQITQPGMDTDQTTTPPGDYGTKESEYKNNTTYEIYGKSDGFVNEYKTVDLDVKKEVKGNQASRDKYFELTVTVPGAEKDVNYVVSVANDSNANTYDGSCDATSGANAATIQDNEGKANFTAGSGTATAPYTVTGQELKDGRKFYLQHGQHIVIRGLPEGSTYVVTENAEDYKKYEPHAGYSMTKNVENYWNDANSATATLRDKDKIKDADGVTATTADDLVRTSFLNVRSGIIPTGLLFSIGGGAMIVLLAAAMLVYLNRRKARRYEA